DRPVRAPQGRAPAFSGAESHRSEPTRTPSALDRSEYPRHPIAARHVAPSSHGDQRLLSLERANGARHGLLHVLFRFVVSVECPLTSVPPRRLRRIGETSPDGVGEGGGPDEPCPQG